MVAQDPAPDGTAALAAGRWEEARAGFEAALAERETAQACFGLATALWWLGDSARSVERCTRAYTLFRRAGVVAGAVDCAIRLAVTYKADYGNIAAANGWTGRAERLLQGSSPGPRHGWVWVTRAYRMPDLAVAEELTRRALNLARECGDVDLELTASSQLGLVRVGRGDHEVGLALLDEAVAAALAGEPSSLDMVVYTCCDMLNACELVGDAQRAEQWCRVADGFAERYGCPFLYAECRVSYGSVLTAVGRWADAERELGTGVRLTADSSPALHRRSLTRLAALRLRQGRLEDAERLLAEAGGAAQAEAEQTLAVSALLLARGDGTQARLVLERRWRRLSRQRAHLAVALDQLVDARLSDGDLDAAGTAFRRLEAVARAARSERLDALADAARGRVARAHGDASAAVETLERAVEGWSSVGSPFEAARARSELAAALAGRDPALAVAQARLALSAFEGLGATMEADRVAAFLRTHGVVPRTGAKGVGLLTDREQQVVRLVGQGLSNPEIAQRLHISRKTAAHHVSNILAKLLLRNRAEAAAYAATSLSEPRSGPP
jgi:ATP/maltotriose-dependent transcriptional regulator MalT